MFQKYKYLLLLLLTSLAYVLFEYYRPKPLNWIPTYQNDDKIPFGTRALFTLLPGLMGQSDIQTVRLPAYNFLTETHPKQPGNYVFICHRLTLDNNDLTQLLRYVRAGNSVFISAYQLPDSLGRALGFRADEKKPTQADTTLRQNFANAGLRKPGGYNFHHDDGRNFLSLGKQPRPNVTVLGRNARHEPVFLRIRYGRGQFLIQNLPLAFTNYYVLDPATSDYAFKALSFLPAGPTYWDEYQKQGRFDEAEQSVFRYVWSEPALRWAYYIVLYGLIVYVLFAGKRTQRIIPVVEPPRNLSLDFVKTVGRLYFGRGDHDNVARKKIAYFLADLRERYNLNTNVLDKSFAETLARKTGTSPDETAHLVRLLRDAQRSISLSEYDLLTISHAIDQFAQNRTGRITGNAPTRSSV